MERTEAEADFVDGGKTSGAVMKVVKNIRDDMIPTSSRVVFDWDNTLKLIDRVKKQTFSRVSKAFLQNLKDKKGCELFIISAIRPSQLNIETLLTEVKRLGLLDIFCPATSRTEFGKRKEVREDFHWVQEGNIIICGYDKAEVFKTVVEKEAGEDVCSSPRTSVIFDDEEENVINFSQIIKRSLCYKIENP